MAQIKPEGYYSDQELSELGVTFGKNVCISKKTSIYCSQLVIENNVRIDDFCILTGQIQIGSFVHIASFSQLSGASGIVLEDFSTLSSRVSLFSRSDDYSGEFMISPMVNEIHTNVSSGPIRVKKHVIIGSGSIVMPKVTLDYGTAVGALSFVTKNTDAWSLYTGIPAKKIKDRKKNILELERSFIKSITQ